MLNTKTFQLNNKKILKILLIIALMIMPLVNAYNYSAYGDFIPYNGDFQNYNPIRRLLAGQVPFVDFEVYLGIGHLYLGSIFTWLLGGTYQASLYAMRIIALAVFEITMYIIVSAILEEKNGALIWVVFIVCLDVACFYRLGVIDIRGLIPEELKVAFDMTRYPGNSARTIRGVISVLTPVLILFWKRTISFYYNEISGLKRYGDIEDYLWAVAVGMILPVAVVWSNDYGISTSIVVYALSVVIFYKRNYTRKFRYISIIGVQTICFLVCLFILLLLVTHGHPSAYIKTTLQVGQYQSWYAVHIGDGKAYYLWDIPILDPYVFFALFIIVFYLCRLLKGDLTYQKLLRYGIPLCILATAFLAIHLYVISDGGGTEFFCIVLFSVVIAEVIKAISLIGAELPKQKGKTYFVILLCSFSIMLSQFGHLIHDRLDLIYEGTYVEGLDTHLHLLGDSINMTGSKLGTHSVFSTYASAIETITNQFQPSGVDYIIHALGDGCRDEYLCAYRNNAPDYVSTIREDYAHWEGYIRGVNWFFYREMLNEYSISFSNTYQDYYVKCHTGRKDIDSECSIKQYQESEGKIRLELQYDADSYNGLADIKLSYNLCGNDNSVKNAFCFKRIAMCHDYNGVNCEDYYKDIPMPGGLNEISIPVIIKNGYGSVTITSYPKDTSLIDITEIEYNGIFQNALDIAHVLSLDDNGDGTYRLVVQGNWVDGYVPFDHIIHEDKEASVKDYYMCDGNTCFVFSDETGFIDGIDTMSSVQLCSR